MLCLDHDQGKVTHMSNHDDTEDRAIIQALIAQGADYAIAEDKAFMAEDSEAEAMAHGGMEATVKALALVLGTDEAHAAQTILTHV